MDKRTDILEAIYGEGREEDRLIRTRHGQMEYLTTMSCIDRYALRPCRVLELGAGTGAYSLTLAREGYEVTALELVGKNVEILQKKARGRSRLQVVQGDALDLSRFEDDSFDLTLCLGPLYHIYDREDMDRVLDEALRVTRPGGVLMTAFLSVHAILYANYLQAPPHDFRAGLDENFDAQMKPRHFPEQAFTGFTLREMEDLYAGKPMEPLAIVSTDGGLEIAEERADFCLSDEDFKAFAAYHLHHCQDRELLGLSSHLLYICRKR